MDNITGTRKKKKQKSKKKNKKKFVDLNTVQEQMELMKEINQQFRTNIRCPFEIGDFVNVRVEYIKSSREFYVFQDGEQSNFDKLQDNLDDSYNESSEIIHQILVGDICAVLFKSKWHRVKIQTIFKHANECEVLFVDYGRSKRVKYSDLRMLKFEFINISPMVIYCKLCVTDQPLLHEREKATATTENTKNGFEIGVMNRFEAIMTHRPTTQIFVKNVIYDRCEVYLYFGGLETDLFRDAYALSECYAAFLINGFSGGEGSGWVKCPSGADELDAETRRDYIERKIPIILKHIESPAEIFVTFQRNVEYFRNMQFQIQRHVSIGLRANNQDMHRPPPIWRRGRNCLVYTKDPGDLYAIYMWHRGQIVEVSNQTFRVRLRDIGTVVVTTVNNLLPIHTSFTSLPDYAVKCHLSGLGYWLASTKEELIAISKMFMLVAMTINGKQNSSLSVTFWGRRQTIDTNLETITEWININNLLKVKSIIKITNDFIKKTVKERILLKALYRESMSELIEHDKLNASDPAIPLNIELNWPDDNKSDNLGYSDESEDEMGVFEFTEPVIYELSGELNEVDVWLPSEPIQKTIFVATPTHITDKLVIYLQDSYREYLANKIRNIIHRKLVLYGDNEVVRVDWNTGQACFAKYHLDGLFYRAQIVRLNRHQRTCLVRFVDYGNVEQCNFEDLRIADMFGNIPTLARKYGLERIRPFGPNRKWADEVLNYCHRLIVHTLCYVRLSQPNYQRDVTPCKITPTGLMDLKTFLIENQWAEHVPRQRRRVP